MDKNLRVTFTLTLNRGTKVHGLTLLHDHTRLQARAEFFNRMVSPWSRLPKRMVNGYTLDRFKGALDICWAAMYPKLELQVACMNPPPWIWCCSWQFSVGNKRTYWLWETVNSGRHYSRLQVGMTGSRIIILSTLDGTETEPIYTIWMKGYPVWTQRTCYSWVA